MSDFRLSCYRLLYQHPLVQYRTMVSDRHYELRVLLIGAGSRMDTLFREILVNGQLLDTHLHVAVLTHNAARAANAQLSKTPELKNYARITYDNIVLNAPDEGTIYADIHYYALGTNDAAFQPTISALSSSGYRYLVISTGNDTKNLAYAKVASALFHAGAVISFVQNKKPTLALDTETDTFAFGFQKDISYLEQMDTIAYNLHYSYCKAKNDRATYRQISSTFTEPYNHLSSLAAAMHIQEKLMCCGINMSENNIDIAAKKFADLINENPMIINRLAALEHRRWMMEKIINGYVQAPSLDYIYSDHDISTHDSNQKWHSCIVTCSENSQLSSSDWKNPENPRSELDALDQMSLRVHVKCGQIEKKNREPIEDSLSAIRNSIKRIFKDQEHIQASMHSMEVAISQMWQKKRSAISIYIVNYNTLRSAASSINDADASHLRNALSNLNNAVAPLKEFISFKDYKNQDRLFIRQIPFALTHKKQPVLIKLLEKKESDCLYSICQLEPYRSVFIEIIMSYDDCINTEKTISNICQFLNNSYPEIIQEYHIVVLDTMEDKISDSIRMLAHDVVYLHPVNDICYETVFPIMRNIVQSANADYIDVTNGDPLLVMCAYKTDIPLIAHKSDSMRNILNAPEIQYPSPKKTISVNEMFDLSGSVLVEESDSSLLSDLSNHYKKLYNISKSTSHWDDFCKHIADHYKNQSKYDIEFPLLNHEEPPVTKAISLNTDIAFSVLPIIYQLANRGYISSVNEARNLSNQRSISFSICGNANGEAVIDKIRQCVRHYSPTISYKVSFKGSRPIVTCSDLVVKDLSLPAKTINEYTHILSGLEKNNLLINYAVDKPKNDNPKISFQFASKDVLNVIQSSGKVLEYYIYYTALLDAHFDDVEMGWHFRHTASKDSPDNEIDIVCTKGTSSLFISAKNGLQKKNINNLNYVLYEIKLLADHFGVNAQAALAMPQIDQFQFNDNTNEWEFSKEVKSAYSRGVYLLGKECFRNNTLGKVLNRISDRKDDWCDFLKPQRTSI